MFASRPRTKTFGAVFARSASRIVHTRTNTSLEKTKWAKFVKKGKLQNMNVYHYYLGRTPGQVSEAEREKILDELFKDAVAVGALLLPRDYEAKDFRLSIVPDQPEQMQRIEIVLKKQPRLEQPRLMPYYFIDRRNNLGHEHVLLTLDQVAAGIDRLLSL